MQNLEYAARVDEVKRRAHGRWTEILGSLGVEERILKKRNGPCPLCGGTDRFQYTDKFGKGNYHCRSCGAGGGFKLLQAARGVRARGRAEPPEAGERPARGGEGDPKKSGSVLCEGVDVKYAWESTSIDRPTR